MGQIYRLIEHIDKGVLWYFILVEKTSIYLQIGIHDSQINSLRCNNSISERISSFAEENLRIVNKIRV